MGPAPSKWKVRGRPVRVTRMAEFEQRRGEGLGTSEGNNHDSDSRFLPVLNDSLFPTGFWIRGCCIVLTKVGSHDRVVDDAVIHLPTCGTIAKLGFTQW